MYFVIILYLFIAAIVGLFGRHTAAGFIGTFVLSILVSPVIVLIFLILMRPDRKTRLMLARARLEREEKRA